MSLPSKEKYIMFLEKKYLKKNIFNSVYNKISKLLKNKGIVLFEIENTVEKLKLSNKLKKINLSFDENPFPNTNTLYIHLFNNQYYSDKNFNKKKVEVEREMLFLLAGKLGVKEINYETELVETNITKINSLLNLKSLNGGITFNKTINKSVGSKGKEEYLNRGAPVYLKSENLQEVEKNIEDRMGMMKSNVFNFDFYKNNSKLESFVYKRYEFKMLKLEYTIETEDFSELSFAINSYFSFFNKYGIDINYDKTISNTESIHYTIEFYNDIELYKEFGRNKRNQMDEFYSIRELYELMDDKDSAVHLITEYVMKVAENYKYKLLNSDITYNFLNNIDMYIKNNEPGMFESICHNFHSTSHIKNWINKNFLTEDMRIINTEKSNINTEKNNINNNDEIPKVNQFEKEYLNKFKKIDNTRVTNLQQELENIANNNINEIINKCDGNKKHIPTLTIPVSINDWEVDENVKSKSESIIETPLGFNDNMFGHYICTMVNSPNISPINNSPNIRPPILPSSSTVSINSDDKPNDLIPITDRESDI